MISQTVSLEAEIMNPTLRVAYVGTTATASILSKLSSYFEIVRFQSLGELSMQLSIQPLPHIIVLETDPAGTIFSFIEMVKKNPLWGDLIIVLTTTNNSEELKKRALKLKVHDYYIIPFPVEQFVERLNFLVKFRVIKPQLSASEKAEIVSSQLPYDKKSVNTKI